MPTSEPLYPPSFGNSAQPDVEPGAKYRVLNTIAGLASAGHYVLHMVAATPDDSYYLNVTPDSAQHLSRMPEPDVNRTDLAAVQDGDRESSSLHVLATLSDNSRGADNQPGIGMREVGMDKLDTWVVDLSDGQAHGLGDPANGGAFPANTLGVIGYIETVDGDNQPRMSMIRSKDGSAPTATDGMPITNKFSAGLTPSVNGDPAELASLQVIQIEANTKIYIEAWTHGTA